VFGEGCHLEQIFKFCNSLCESNCRLDTNVNAKIEAKNDECKSEEINNLHKDKHFKFELCILDVISEVISIFYIFKIE